MSQKAVIYARVSSESQRREGHGDEAQIARCRDFAEKNGYEIVRVFNDQAVSGKIAERPELHALLDFLAKNPGTTVIADDIKRIARETEVHIFIRKSIKKLKCEVLVLNQRLEDTPEGRFVETVLAGAAQLEREQNARQVKQKMIERMKAGYYCLCAPTGYKYDKISGNKVIVRDEPAATLMAEALTGYASGRFNSQKDASDYLARHGVKLGRSKFAEQCRNKLYAGIIDYPRWDIYGVQGQHEPIISLKTFEDIQTKLDGRPDVRGTDLSSEFPLRGYIFCEKCNRQMTGYFTKGNGGKYPYYACNNNKCDKYKHGLKRDAVHASFNYLLKEKAPTEELIELFDMMFDEIYNKHVKTVYVERSAVKQKIDQLERSIDNLVKRLAQTGNNLVIDRIENEIVRLEREKIEYQAKLDSETVSLEECRTKLNVVLDFAKNIDKHWESSSLETKRLVVEFVFNDKFFFNQELVCRTTENSLNKGFMGFLSRNLSNGGDGGTLIAQPILDRIEYEYRRITSILQDKQLVHM